MEPRPYDLCARTFQFANAVLDWVAKCPRNLITLELLRQLVKASASVGANTEESEEAQSIKDQASKLGIARKEIRESRYWLRLLKPRVGPQNNPDELIQEATELNNIFKSRIRKLQDE